MTPLSAPSQVWESQALESGLYQVCLVFFMMPRLEPRISCTPHTELRLQTGVSFFSIEFCQKAQETEDTTEITRKEPLWLQDGWLGLRPRCQAGQLKVMGESKPTSGCPTDSKAIFLICSVRDCEGPSPASSGLLTSEEQLLG